jgi:hypothetical protein
LAIDSAGVLSIPVIVDDRGKELAKPLNFPNTKKSLASFCFGSERSRSLIPNNTCCLE